MLVLKGGTTPMSATVAYARLTAEIVGPAFGKLGAWNIGMKDLVDGSIVEDDVARRFGDACLEEAVWRCLKRGQ
jgi:hypothetical protein